MRLAVSNIAWDAPEQAAVLDLLGSRAVRGIELAPTKLWPEWRGASPEAARTARAELAEGGFSVPALQAILYGRPELQVFGTGTEQRRALLDHLEHVAAIAQALGAPVLVFGSPKNRDRGTLEPKEAFSAAVDFFREAAEVCAGAGARLCIEPNPPAYACNFATTWREAAALAREVDHPGFGLHLDTGCIHLAGDDPGEAIVECADILAHFHISEPHLSDFSAPAIDHGRAGRALAGSGYPGWVSIEMRRSDDPLASIAQAVDAALRWYGQP